MSKQKPSDIKAAQETSEEASRHDQLIRKLTDAFHHQVPFHKLLGFRFDEISADGCRISFENKPELVGNFMQGILHGGVSATALDVVGGAMAVAGMLSKNLDASEAVIAKKLAKVSTIDLRVDYVRPGRGEAFYAKARLLRSGNKVAVVRMELHNEDDTLIALGTGTYMTG